jgi:uncharacterized protein YgiM (DUF1202 family)
MPSRPAEEAAIGTARVTTASLNVRKAGSLDGEIVTQVKKGERVSILQNGDDWLRVRLGDGTVGWVSRSLVAIEGEKSTKKKTGCDTDFQFAKMPTPAFSDSSRHGLVVVEANVNTKGDVTSTRVITNTTGDEALGFLAEREMKSTKFVAPMRNCVPRAFIFTYKRSF